MDNGREENVFHLENITDICIKRDNHSSSEKCQSTLLNENGPRDSSSEKCQSTLLNENGPHDSSSEKCQNTSISENGPRNSSEKCQSTSLSENGPREKRENSTQEDRISRKSEQIERLENEKQRSVTINIPLEKNKSRKNNKRYKKRYFCCGSLADGAIASANYSNVISVLMIISSLHVFFNDSNADDGMNKAVAFSAVVYAICYIRSSTNLKRAIDEEQREKIIPWIIFTMLTTFFLLSEAIYVSVTYWEELDNFDEDLTVPCLRLILIAFLAFVGCTLIYCTYGVIRLFKSMAGPDVPANSLMTDIRVFINGVSV